jgi:DNA-binding LacI/PurR family transcriptional regulator
VELARYVTPPLTTVHQPKLRLGELAMQMLLDVLEGRPVANQVLATELVMRASTAPVPLQVIEARSPTVLGIDNRLGL